MTWTRIAALLLCGALIFCGGCSSRRVGGASSQESASQAPSDPQEPPLPLLSDVTNPYAYVTQDIDFGLPQPTGPAFLHPAEDTAVSGQRYYLTGISDHSRELLLNDEPVENRGDNGSFAVSVMLEEGDNKFQLRQGDDTATVTIRYGATEADIPLTDQITKMTPAQDLAAPAGQPFTLQCVAPAGADVTARINGETVQLRQNAAAAVAGVPANFSAQYALPEARGIAELGTVTYLLDGKEFPSEGKLFSIEDGGKLIVQIRNVSSSVFAGPSVNSAIVTTGKAGAVDEVTEFGGDSASGEMYKLRMGGWIQAAAATPVAGDVEIDNHVSGVEFSREGRRETFTFRGTSRPFYTANRQDGALVVRFHHTGGIESPDVSESALFSAAEAAPDGSDEILTLRLREADALWGYLVEYDGGDTLLTCIQRPELAGGDAPLTGVTVAVDAGHGGSDTGTLGLPYDGFPAEKDITIVTAQALEKQLGLLGARVVMVRRDDENPTMNERMERARAAWADFYISLHGNGAGYSNDLIAANGLEVYYFEPIAQRLAQMLSANISANTGRKNRGAQYSNYRVTMLSFAPAVLVELGFLPNPQDFDSMCSPEGIYRTATSITDTLISFLTPEAETGEADD